MKIVFFEIEDWEKDILEPQLSEHTTVFLRDKLDEKTVFQAEDAGIISTFIYSNLQKNILEKIPMTKLIVTRSTGYDHIDTVFCKERNITVTNIPTYGIHSVAEHTFALILALTRKIIQSVEQTRRGNFSQDGLEATDLSGKTLGVIGTGKIGKKVAIIGKGFDMNIVAYNRSEDDELKTKYDVAYKSLEEVLKESDVISIHLPLISETHHLIHSKNITLFKKGSILINTARGPIVETQAILDGLESKILSGVGLDVLEEEKPLREERELLTSDYIEKSTVKTQLLDHILLNRDDVIVTPHNAFNSKEALRQILQVTAENIKSFLNNNPINLVE